MKQSIEQRQGLSQEMRLNQYQQQSLHIMQSGVVDLLSEIEELRKKYPELQWKDGEPGEWDLGKVALQKRKRYPGEWVLESQNHHFLSIKKWEEQSDAKQQLLENYPDEEDSPELRETLREQIYLWNLSAQEKEFCEFVLQNIDERGLNYENPMLVAATIFSKNTIRLQKQKYTKLLRSIQELEPFGCACDSPLQSLTIQAELRFPSSDLAKILRGLPSLEVLINKEGFFDYLNRLGFSEEKSGELLRDLQTLEPYPARGYRIGTDARNFRIYPEIQVQFQANSKVMEVELLNNLGVKLEIIPKNAEKRRKHFQEAHFLLQQLHRREETLLRIAQSVFAQQEAFVVKGVKEIQVLRLQTVAEELNMHVSTISRCIQSKYCKTPWGTYPLRFFFSQGARSGQSREQIKERLLEILRESSLTITAGSKPKPSDSELARRLEKIGIQLARRTVAKYRAELISERRL